MAELLQEGPEKHLAELDACVCAAVDMYIQEPLEADSHKYISTYIHTHLPTYLPTYLRACVRACMHACIYVHTQTHILIQLNL